jgi:8-oxo-dGTP diphosphatase
MNIDKKKSDYEKAINNPIAKFDINPLIVKDKKILLGKRIENVQFGGTWHMPGGKVFLNERFIDSLKRMTKLKTNLDIDYMFETTNSSLVGVYDDPIRDPREHVAGITFFCKVLSGELKPGGNCSDVKFFDESEIKSLNTAFGHDYMLLDGVTILKQKDLI